MQTTMHGDRSPHRILVKRTGAFGDVIDVTPVIRRLRQENPHAEIDVDTQYSRVFWNSPHRIGLKRDLPYDRIIDLDMAFERNLRQVGIVESYMEVAFGDRCGSTQLEMSYGPPPEFGLDWSLAITMHPARSWPQRTLPVNFWVDLANILAKRGWIVLCLGTRQDWGFRGHRVVDLRDQFDMQMQAAVIGASRAFVCSESGPMMLAQATDVPIVALHTMALPWMTARERHGVIGWRFHAISAPIGCIGCSHRLARPSTYFPCERDDNICVTLFEPEAIANEVESAAREAVSA
jgi:ADP-heptose:LPS heptosyltransferase